MKRIMDGAMAAGLALFVWQMVVWFTGVPHFILPSPLRVAGVLVSSYELIAEHTLVTIIEVLVGMVMGSVLGAITAIHLAASPFSRRILLPVLVFSQAVPVFALAPILTLWLGYGIWSKIVMTILIIYFPVTSAFHDGLNRVDKGMLDLSRLMGATQNMEMWLVRIPAALPSLASGLRLAAVYAPIGAVLGEWVGASNGLGYLMLLANGRAKTDLMFAALFVLAAFTVLLHICVSHGANRLTDWAQGRESRT